MYKGRLLASQIAANTNIPFITVLNTNTSLSVENGVVTFNVPGKYKVDAILNLVGVAQGNITAQIMAGGSSITDSVVGATSGATTDLITLPVCDVLNIKQNENDSDKASISVQVSAAATVTNGVLIVSKIS